MWTVYALRERGTVEPRYVGMTKAPKNRLAQHKWTYKRMPAPDAFAHWIKTANLELVELEQAATEAEARAVERRTIGEFLALGHRLFNRKLATVQAPNACNVADAPKCSIIADKAGISRAYASEIATGKRTPSQSLAIHIYRTTGWKHPRIANLTDEQIDALAEILAAAA